MLDETYKDPQVVAKFGRFVFLKVDVDEHPEVSMRFGVAGILGARILKADGTEVVRFVDFKGADEVREVPRSARAAGGGGR